MKDLESIIHNCLKGDQKACKSLYDYYLPYCYGICNRYHVGQDQLKDFLQIIFSEIFRVLDKFDSSKAGFKTWITRISINQIIQQYRKNNRSISVLDLEQVNIETEYGEPDGVLDEMSYNELIGLLAHMPKQLLVVFNLRIVDGYSHNEIASILSIKEGTSRVILARARQWAQKTLNENYWLEKKQ